MFSGSLVALVTPFTEDGEVNYQDLKRLVDYHIAAGTNGLAVIGTSGEAATLTLDEQLKVINKTLEYANGQIQIIAGAGANSTASAQKLTKLLNDTGIAGILSVTPYYNKPTQAGLIAHFSAIAAVSNNPIILYNVPSRTGCDLLPESVAELSKLENIVAIKDATGDISRVALTKKLCGDDFIQLSGDDASLIEFMQAGGRGCISVTANIAAAAMAKILKLCLSADYLQAKQLNESLQGLHENLFVESNPIPVKWAAYKLKLISSSQLRLPLLSLSSKVQPQVKAALEQANLL